MYMVRMMYGSSTEFRRTQTTEWASICFSGGMWLGKILPKMGKTIVR